MATAWQLLEQKPELSLLLVEKEDAVARHQTGNNSGVIHSGIYYKPGSLKAINCITGYRMLLEFADRYDIPYELCGKVIVATGESQLPQLDMIYQRGMENGLSQCRMLSEAELKEIEPHCRGIKAIHVPYTGIIDYTAVANQLAQLIRKKNGEIRLKHRVTDIQPIQGGAVVKTSAGQFQTRMVVNCAGLFSDKIAALTEPSLGVRIIPFRGEYYKLKEERKYLVKTLIYPVPDPNFPFLGVHFTRMIDGGVEAGPNAVFAFRREGYTRSAFSWSDLLGSLSWPGFRKVARKYWRTGMGEYYRSFSKSAFTRALQQLVPEVRKQDLVPGGAGVRAQACDRTGGLIDDFLFLEKPFIVNVLNAPSPAATSSLSIGKTVSDIVLRRL